jgi:hypothetical protein
MGTGYLKNGVWNRGPGAVELIKGPQIGAINGDTD